MKTRTVPSGMILIASLLLTVACQSESPAPAKQAIDDEHHSMTVYHDPNCGCCGKWAEHMQAHGFDVETVPTTDMNRVKRELGVPRELPSCHTAVVGDYVIEGHVPAEDVLRLLAEQPEAHGLSVPGMPLGSPGMEMGDRRMPYDVILFEEDGDTRVFNHYEAID